MRKSIHKIASLFMAMAMILSVLAMPALATERALHTHNYIPTVTGTSCSLVDDYQHVTITEYTYTCDCKSAYQDVVTVYGDHVPNGGPIGSQTTVDDSGNPIVVTLYRCGVCKDTYATRS